MRIMVVSDTHGRYGMLRDTIFSQVKAEIVIFLGDGINDFEKAKFEFPQKMMAGVCGNCDYLSEYKFYDLLNINGKRIFFTHGHKYNVKGNISIIISAAKERSADICLFGHTHKAYIDYIDGMHIMNPGSLGAPRDGVPSYGYIDITPAGIFKNIVEL